MKYFVVMSRCAALAAMVLCLASTRLSADASSAPPPKPPTPALLQMMVGDWSVSQKMWSGRGAAAADMPEAKAHRSLTLSGFIEERMEAAQADVGDPFSRVAYFGFNTTSRRYEYFSLDSRLPQMMNERSAVVTGSIEASSGVRMAGSHFVAPTWGKSHDVPFLYRLSVDAVRNDRQVIRLFLTPESGEDRQEFLAFEYRYARTH